MSASELPCPETFSSPALIGIVASVFNQEYTDSLIENCVRELEVLAPWAEVSIIRVPGAYEIPVTVRAMAAAQAPPDVIISFGLIIRGGTEHGDLIAQSVTTALQDIAVTYGTPAINQVLLVNNEEQARERCMGNKLNRGTEGAKAAATMLHVRQQLISQYPPKNAQ